MPGLCRAHLLTLLHAGFPLPRCLQAPCPLWRAAQRADALSAAQAFARPAGPGAAALSRRVQPHRLGAGAYLLRLLLAGRQPEPGPGRAAGQRLLAGVRLHSAGGGHFRLAASAGARILAGRGGGKPPPDPAAAGRDRRPPQDRRQARPRAGGGGGRQHRQDPLHRGGEPRAAHPAERRAGLCAAIGKRRNHPAPAAGDHRHHPPLGRASARAHRRADGYFQDRGRADRDRAAGGEFP